MVIEAERHLQISDTLPEFSIRPAQILTGEGPAEFMRERASIMYDMTPIHSHRNTGIYTTKNWYFDHFMFAHVKNEASVVGRSKAQAETGAGLVFLHRYFDGGIRGVMDDTSIDRDPGQMYMIDQARRVDCIQFPNQVHGVFIPKNLIGYDSGQHPAFIRFSDNRVLGALLYRSFDRVFGDVQLHGTVDLATLNQLVACIKMSLGSDRRDGDVRRQAREALADMIRAYVDRNLTHLDLSAATILKNFGLSRASLFRMFEPDGGFRRFVNRRRLHRAVLDIAQKPGKRGSISEAAERWGFSSDSNFNRSVKDEFGVSPGALVDFPIHNLEITSPRNDLIAHLDRLQTGHNTLPSTPQTLGI